MKYYFALVTACFLVGCSSSIDPDLLAQIENRTELTESLFETYEDLNDELMDVIESQDYAYKKLIKVRDRIRVINNRINNRQMRLQMSKNPALAAQETDTEQAPKEVDPTAVETHQEKLNEYTEEQTELLAEAEEWLAETRKFTAQALELRTARNNAYEEYTKSRQELQKLHKQAGQE